MCHFLQLFEVFTPAVFDCALLGLKAWSSIFIQSQIYKVFFLKPFSKVSTYNHKSPHTHLFLKHDGDFSVTSIVLFSLWIKFAIFLVDKSFSFCCLYSLHLFRPDPDHSDQDYLILFWQWDMSFLNDLLLGCV